METFATADAELLAVLTKVELDGLLDGANLKESLRQWLGEGGRALSGGEQRRLSLARALLHDAPLLCSMRVTEGVRSGNRTAYYATRRLQHCIGKSVLMITLPTGPVWNKWTGIALLEMAFQLRPHDELLRQDRYYRQLFHHLDDE